jgi:hypothetical protein
MHTQAPVTTLTLQRAQNSAPEAVVAPVPPDAEDKERANKAQTEQPAADQVKADQVKADQVKADQDRKEQAPAAAENRAGSRKARAAIHAPADRAKTHRLLASTRVPVRGDAVAQKHMTANAAPQVSQSDAAASVALPAAADGSQSSVPVPEARQPSYAPAPAPAPQAQPQYQAAPQNSSSPSEPYPQPHVVTLAAGTNLAIRLLETLSTDHNYTGDTFRGTLESPIIMDGFIIADRGSKVLGRIASAQKAGHLEGLADLVLTLTEINTTDGQRVRIETNTFDKKGSSSAGEDVAKIAGGAALGAIIGGVAGGGKGAAIGAGAGGAVGTGAVIATRGKPAVLATETRLNFQLTSPVTITEKLNN